MKWKKRSRVQYFSLNYDFKKYKYFLLYYLRVGGFFYLFSIFITIVVGKVSDI